MIISGPSRNNAFFQLKNSTNLRLKLKNGEILIKVGRTVTSSDKMLQQAILDEKITVNIATTTKNNVDGMALIGGYFAGNKKLEDGSINTLQIVNPEHTSVLDAIMFTRSGTYLLHELLESYIGGIDSPNAPPADTNHMDGYNVYLNAHNKAIDLDPHFQPLKTSYNNLTNTTTIFPKYSYDYRGDTPIKVNDYIIDHNK